MKTSRRVAAILFVWLSALLAPSITYACDNPTSVVLKRSAKAILFGPKKPGSCLNEHIFRNIKRATIVRDPDGKIVSMTGKFSHHLGWRPDDQIYYTVNFIDGTTGLRQPDLDHKIVEYDGGGWSSIVQIVLTPVDGLQIALPGGVAKLTINAENVSAVARGVSRLIEGRGWQTQADALISFAALYAAIPPEVAREALR